MPEPAQALRILVIDDNEGDRFYVADLLRDVAVSRYEVDWAASFEQGLALIAEARHDAYLVDHQLGTRTGIELLSVARETRATRPFIMLTGRRDSSVERDAMREGAADFRSRTSSPPGNGSAPSATRSSATGCWWKRTTPPTTTP